MTTVTGDAATLRDELTPLRARLDAAEQALRDLMAFDADYPILEDKQAWLAARRRAEAILELPMTSARTGA